MKPLTRYDLVNGQMVESEHGSFCDYVEAGMAIEKAEYWADVEKERTKKAWEEVGRIREEVEDLEERLMGDDA